MNLDSNDPRRKSRTPENRPDSFNESDIEYRGFKPLSSASFNARKSYHQERPLERNDSSNSQMRRNSSDISGIDLSELKDKSFHEIRTKIPGEISRSNSSGDLTEALLDAIAEIRDEVKPIREYRQLPQTVEEFQIELERVRKEMIEVSFNIKYGSNLMALSELKWGSPVKSSGNYQKFEPERRTEPSFTKKKPCYMPDSPPCASSRTKSILSRAYDTPDSPSASISTDSFYGGDRASKRKARDQITTYAETIETQSDEDNESVKTDYTLVVPKKRKNNKGNNKNVQNKPAGKKNENQLKNQKKLFDPDNLNKQKENSSLVDISMEEDSAKAIVEVTDDEEDAIYTARRKNMSLTKKIGMAKDYLQNTEKNMQGQMQNDENEKEKEMNADVASRSSSTPNSRFKKNISKVKVQEEQVCCPMCNKDFDRSMIENHAYDCNGSD